MRMCGVHTIFYYHFNISKQTQRDQVLLPLTPPIPCPKVYNYSGRLTCSSPGPYHSNLILWNCTKRLEECHYQLLGKSEGTFWLSSLYTLRVFVFVTTMYYFKIFNKTIQIYSYGSLRLKQMISKHLGGAPPKEHLPHPTHIL